MAVCASTEAMRLGSALPLSGFPAGLFEADTYARWATLVEQLGYESIWTFDAVGRGFMLPDPLMALTTVAGATTTVELGTGILQTPIRNVAEIAHRVFTLELLAPGRVLFGVGPGSTAADFDAFGGDYAGRFDRFDQQWDALRTWISSGRHGDRDLTPWPSVIDGPTLMVAGWRGGWVERAANEAGGWIASGVHADDDQLADNIRRYRDAGGQRAIVTNVQVDDDVERTIERLLRLEAMGYDDAVVFDLAPTEERLRALRNAIAH